MHGFVCRTMKHMQKRLRDDELRVLRGEVEVDEAQLEADSADLDSSGSEDSAQQPRQAAADFVSVKQRGSMQTTDKGILLGFVAAAVALVSLSSNTNSKEQLSATELVSCPEDKGLVFSLPFGCFLPKWQELFALQQTRSCSTEAIHLLG